MPFTPDNADLKHYSGTTKEACEQGFERSDMPADDGSQGTGRLLGRRYQTEPTEPVKDSD